MSAVDPRNVDWRRWSSETQSTHLARGNLPWNIPEEEWQRWAHIASTSPQYAALNIPRAEGFKHWRDWAIRFNEALWIAGLS